MSDRGFRSGFVTLVGRPERREVDAAEPDRRPEGLDRLGPAADDADPGARRPHDARRRSSCSSTPPASTGPARCSASGRTSVRSRPSPRSTWCARWSPPNEGIGPGDEFVARLVQESGTASVLVVNKVDAASPAAIGRRLADAAEPARRVRRVRAGLGPHRRGRRRPARRARGPAAGGTGVLPGRHGERPARDDARRRARAGEAARGRPRRAAALDRGDRRAARGRTRARIPTSSGSRSSSGSSAIRRRGS